jgi:hypothetical protein
MTPRAKQPSASCLHLAATNIGSRGERQTKPDSHCNLGGLRDAAKCFRGLGALGKKKEKGEI